MNTKPFSPDEARANKRNVIPSFVIEAVNEILAERYTGHRITILQKEIVARIKAKQFIAGIDGDPFENKWLDFEPIYEDEGWKIAYDKPGYNESYEASFTFTPKDTR